MQLQAVAGVRDDPHVESCLRRVVGSLLRAQILIGADEAVGRTAEERVCAPSTSSVGTLIAREGAVSGGPELSRGIPCPSSAPEVRSLSSSSAAMVVRSAPGA